MIYNMHIMFIFIYIVNLKVSHFCGSCSSCRHFSFQSSWQPVMAPSPRSPSKMLSPRHQPVALVKTSIWDVSCNKIHPFVFTYIHVWIIHASYVCSSHLYSLCLVFGVFFLHLHTHRFSRKTPSLSFFY